MRTFRFLGGTGVDREAAEPCLHISKTRRDILVLAAATLPLSGAASAQSALAYQVLTLSTNGFPMAAVGTCAQLEAHIHALKAEAQVAWNDPDKAGAELHKRAQAARGELSLSVQSARAALQGAKLDETLKAVGLGVSAVFIGLGLTLSGSTAIGLLAGATVVAGTAMLTVEAYFKAGAAKPAMVAGYARDRFLMFTEIAAAGAGKKLLAGCVSVAALYVGAFELLTANGEKAKGEEALRLAIERLVEIDKTLDEIGTDIKAWGRIRHEQSLAGAKGLQEWVDATRGTNCMLSLSQPGPVLRKP